MKRGIRTPPKRPGVDIEKLIVAMHGLKRRDLATVAERALRHVPHADLPEVAHGFVKPDAIMRGAPGSAGTLKEVEAFHEACLRKEYYQSFAVNSHNFMQKSEATEEFIAECDRLLEGCTDAAKESTDARVREAFDLIFDLLRRVDRGDEIVFWSDEGGSYEVGADWRKVLPAYFKCLATSANPEEYATRVHQAVKDFANYDRAHFFGAARRAANKEQKAALARISASK